MTKPVQGVTIPMLEEVAITANKKIEFQIVIRTLALGSLKNATLTAAIAAAKEQPFNAVWRKNADNCFLHQFGAVVEMLFERVIAIYRVTRAWARRASHRGHVRRGELG